MRRFLFSFAALTLTVLACNAPTNAPGTSTTVTPSLDGPIPAVITEGVPGNDLTPASTDEPALPINLPKPVYAIGEDGQIWRVETDGVTVTQITTEDSPVISVDVSTTDGSIAYISGNDLLNVDSLGGNRALLVDGPPPPADTDYTGQVSSKLDHVYWSPDGLQIAYGMGGVNLYDILAGTSSLLIASDPFPEDSFPEGPTRFYYPSEWSPDGTRLLVDYGLFPEGGGISVLNLDGTLTDIINPDGFVCCDETWSLDGQSIYWANPQPGIVPAGLWRANAETGITEILIHGESEGGWMMPAFPLQLRDGYLYIFFAITSEFPDAALSPLSPTRSDTDGYTGRETLHDDGFIPFEVLWAADGSGALIVPYDTGRFPEYGPLLWIPADGSPTTTLPLTGTHLAWGQ